MRVLHWARNEDEENLSEQQKSYAFDGSSGTREHVFPGYLLNKSESDPFDVVDHR